MTIEYFPVDPRGTRLSVGLRSLDLAQWLDIDGNREKELADKAEVWKSGAEVFAALPGSEAACDELLELVLANLAQFHPNKFLIDLSELEHPLLWLGEHLQEDFCVLQKEAGEWILTAAILFSPSRWRLMEKLGKSLRQIHQPVPHLNQEIGEALEFSFDRVTVDRPMWRANWTLMDDARNFQPEPPSEFERAKFDQSDIGNAMFFRVERQTLRRLPKSDAIVFTIRTYVHSLAEVVASVPDSRQLLTRAIETADSEHLKYKGWTNVKSAMLDYLS